MLHVCNVVVVVGGEGAPSPSYGTMLPLIWLGCKYFWGKKIAILSVAEVSGLRSTHDSQLIIHQIISNGCRGCVKTRK